MSRKQRTGLRFQPAGGAQPSGPVVGQKQQLTIERLAHDGRGIGFAARRTWFVMGALPGEQVQARVLAARSKVVDAQVERVLQPHPERQTPFCSDAGQCGGCTLQPMPVAQQREFKQAFLAEQLERAGVEVQQWWPTLTGPEQGYRRRARIAVRRDKSGQVHVGFRAHASQQIISVAECPVLVPALQPAFKQLCDFVRQLPSAGAIGHLELFSGTTAALLVRLTRPLNAAEQAAWRRFCTSLPLQLWWQDDAEPYPDQPQQALAYPLEPYGLQVNYRPGDFAQVNASVNLAMLEQALQWLELQPEDRVLDLFSGLGNFTLPMAQQVAEVVAVEGVAGMVERAQATAQQQGLTNVSCHHHDLSQPFATASWAQAGFNAIVLDPPRDGAAEAVAQLAKLNAEKILYVSCNPATLARDAAVLVELGYALVRLSAVDMFTHTGHVEAMALFESRVKKES